MVQSNPQLQRTHLLFEFVEDCEITVHTIVLGDQLEHWDAHVAKNYVVALIEDHVVIYALVAYHVILISPLIEVDAGFSHLIDFLSVSLDYIVSYLKYRPLILQVLKDFCVHL